MGVVKASLCLAIIRAESSSSSEMYTLISDAVSSQDIQMNRDSSMPVLPTVRILRVCWSYVPKF